MNGCSRSCHLAVKVVVCLMLLGSMGCGPQGLEDELELGEGKDGKGAITGKLAGPSASVPETELAEGQSSQALGDIGLLSFDLGYAMGMPVRTGNTCGAYNESNPPCAYSVASDNTFLWRAPYAGEFYMNTLGSSYDTVLHVYDNATGALLNCNDDFDGGLLSGLVVNLAANQQVRIVVDGYAAICGNYHLSISCSGINCPAWTSWTSEEYPPIGCNGNNTLVNKAKCRGSKCDDIQWYCEHSNGVRGSGQYWTGYFSEEGASYGGNSRTCLPGYWVTGLSCTGNYCDNIALQCTQMNNISWSASSCYWTSWFSEEYGGLQTFPGYYYAVGAKCSGSNCDNMSYYVCAAW